MLLRAPRSAPGTRNGRNGHRAGRAAGHVPCPDARHGLVPVPTSAVTENNHPKSPFFSYLCWTKRNSRLWAGKCDSLPRAGLGSPARQQRAGMKTNISNSCCPWGLLLQGSLELETASRKEGVLVPIPTSRNPSVPQIPSQPQSRTEVGIFRGRCSAGQAGLGKMD